MSLSIIVLGLSLLGLLLGPALIAVRANLAPWRSVLDGFALITVGGLATLHMLPEALSQGGAPALGFALVGAALPLWLERRSAGATGPWTSILLVLGLMPHAALEATALATASGEQLGGVGAAVIAHRLPLGMILYMALSRHLGARGGLGGIAALGAATVLGFFAGDALSHAVSPAALAWLQAGVAGSLLHVIVSHTLETPDPERRVHGWSTLGALLGVVVLVTSLLSGDAHHHHDAHGHHHGHDHAHDHAHEVVADASLTLAETFSCLAHEAAPLMLGLLLLGVLAYAALGARVARWLAPEDATARVADPAALAVSLPLLGLEFTIARALGAALMVGLARAAWGAYHAPEVPPGSSPRRDAARFGLLTLFDHAIPWLLLGLLVAAWLEPVLGHELWQGIPGVVLIASFGLLGALAPLTPLGATPIATLLMHKGASASATLALVWMVPVGGLARVRALVERRGLGVAVACVIGLLGVVIALGLVATPFNLSVHLHDLHGPHEKSWLQRGALVVLGVMLVGSMLRQGPRAALTPAGLGLHHDHDGHEHGEHEDA